MRTQFYLSVFFLLITTSIIAGNLSGSAIKGNVIDEEKKPLEYVVVTLLKAEDSTLQTGMLTSSDGKFFFGGLKTGNYIITLSFTGFDKKWIGPFSLKEDETISQPDLILNSSKNLKEVAVVAVQPLFVQKPGMLVMNVENSAVRISGTAYDVVSRAPGVSIDQDGNISLKGKSGVQVYIDGKPTYLSPDQLRDYLMNMPAVDIVKLELMTTPPAKHNAEGSSGIINIVTQKSKKQGFTGTANAGFGQGNASREEAGISLNYGKPKYYIYGKYDFSTPSRKEKKIVHRTVYDGSHTTDFDQDVDLAFNLRSQNMKAGVDFFPSKNISFGLRADASDFTRNVDLDSKTKITKVDSGNVNTLHQTNLLKGEFKNGSLGFYYNQKLDTVGSELNVSLDYVNYHNRSTENYNLHFLDNYGAEIYDPQYQRSYPNTDIGIYVGQIDYTHPFRKKYKIEAGIKSSYVKTTNDLLFEIQNNNTNDWQKDTTRTNSFIYTEQINAAYLSGTADLGKWQLQGGLRAEQTNSNGNSPTTHQDHINNYVQLFPSLFVTQKISDEHSLQYTIARRINRPAYDALNPFYFYVDQYLYKIGNPFLQPEIANSADITYDYKDFIFASIGASRTTAGIAHVTHLIDSTGVMNQTSVNMNTIDNCYLSLTFSKSFTKWWTNENSLVLNYNHYLATLSGANLDRSNITYNMSATESFLLKYGIKIEASAWYQSPTVYSIFLIQPAGDVSLGISKSFLKNKLKCTVNVSDMLYTQSQRVLVDFVDQHINTTYNFDSRFVYVRMRYNFGKTDAAKKSQFKNAADDLQKRVG
ncbi:MAG: TonB-dependent receptor domain-containing protein [Bacteroidia bacterium]